MKLQYCFTGLKEREENLKEMNLKMKAFKKEEDIQRRLVGKVQETEDFLRKEELSSEELKEHFSKNDYQEKKTTQSW